MKLYMASYMRDTYICCDVIQNESQWRPSSKNKRSPPLIYS